MDWWALIATGTTTGIVSVGAAAYLAKTLIENRIAKERVNYEASIRAMVETALADSAAQRAYEWEARKRLYEAVGVLRFQLLIACRDLAGRIEAHGTRERYSTDYDTYYGKSTLYRLIRPVSIAMLIERQIAFADFSVDASAVSLVKLAYQMRMCLSGDHLVAGIDGLEWEEQKEHVFSETLANAAAALIVESPGSGARVMRFDEFEVQLLKSDFVRQISPFPALLKDFSPTKKPILWLRLIGYGAICGAFASEHGRALGFRKREMPVEVLLKHAHDARIDANLFQLTQRCTELPQLDW